jgi:hypothetical protein
MAGKTSKYAIPFGYNFTGDVATSQNLGGVSFTGSVFTINVQSLQGVTNVPEIRSMQLYQEFAEVYGSTNTPAVGALYIYAPSTGQLVVIGYAAGQVTNSATSGTAITTGVVPIVVSNPSILQIGKAVDPYPGAPLAGKLVGTLYTFDVPPYLNYGLVQ